MVSMASTAQSCVDTVRRGQFVMILRGCVLMDVRITGADINVTVGMQIVFLELSCDCRIYHSKEKENLFNH
jgi:hypothetical protein